MSGDHNMYCSANQPDTLLEDIYTESDLCKNEDAQDIADLLDRAANRITRQDARIKELRDTTELYMRCLTEASDRIKELEAKISIAVESLETAKNGIAWYIDNSDDSRECDDEALAQMNEALTKLAAPTKENGK